MKASELRIGNLINGIYYDYNIDDDHREKETICEVVTLDSVGSCEYPIWVESESNIETFSDFEPIPLTEEWLLKFGFEINRQTKEENNIWRCYSEEGFFEVEQIGSSFFLDDNDCYGTKINHVHQLQNLYFALTGEELTLKP